MQFKHKTPKEIPVLFHNGSTYKYKFIIKELAKDFEGQFECLGENTETYITFSVPIKKELGNGKTITCKIKFIDSSRFMSSSLSSLIDDLSEGLHYDKCIDCETYLDYMITKDDQISVLIVKRIIRQTLIKRFNLIKFNLIKRFASTYEFCDRDINTFILLLRQRVYPYEHMNSWERFDEELLPDRDPFYSSLNMEDITDVDYRHAKKVYKEFNNKNVGDSHDILYIIKIY